MTWRDRIYPAVIAARDSGRAANLDGRELAKHVAAAFLPWMAASGEWPDEAAVEMWPGVRGWWPYRVW